MSIPVIENVIIKLQDHLGVKLHKLSNKRIIYKGTRVDGCEILVCTPQSKIYPDGRGWVDITTIQTAMLEEAYISILAFRLDGNKIYYLNFRDLKPYLTDQALINNDREGDHWKLHIWPDHIKVLGNSKTLAIAPDGINKLGTGSR